MGGRQKVWFTSAGTACAAWHYPGTTGACVVMSGGFAVTKEPGTDRFAQRFADAGFSVLAFDPRGLGESAGQPREVVSLSAQRLDWSAALAFAQHLPEVDPARVAVWSFSLTGGLILQVATQHPELAAAIAQSPTVDGAAATRNAMRFTTTSALARLTGRGLLDALGGLLRRPPLLVPTAGEPGTVAVLSTPDAVAGADALDPEHTCTGWSRNVAARSVLGAGSYRPIRYAARVPCPLLVVVCDQDQSALAAPAVRAAGLAPQGELVRMAGGHYAPFLDAHEDVVTAELEFLRRHLLQPSVPTGRDARRS